LVVFGSASLPHFPPSLILIYSRIRRLGYWRSILVWSSLRKGIIKYILFDLEPAKVESHAYFSFWHHSSRYARPIQIPE